MAGSLVLLAACAARVSNRAPNSPEQQGQTPIPTAAHSMSLADARDALAGNKFRRAAEAFAGIGADTSRNARERACAYRAESMARAARRDFDAEVGALTQALMLDSAYPGNPLLLQRVEALLIRGGRCASWIRHGERMLEALEGVPALRLSWLDLAACDQELRNRIDASLALHAEMRRVVDWRVIGPFDNSAGGAVDRVFPPEVEFDPEARYIDAKGRPIYWHGAPPVSYGIVNLDVLLADPSHAATYALTHVRIDEETEALVHLSGSGAFRLWINDRLVLDEPLVRQSKEELYRVPVRLHQGWNRVLVKACVESEPLFFYLSFTDTTGLPLEVVASAEPQPYTSDRGAGETTASELAVLGEEDWLRRWSRSATSAPLADAVLRAKWLRSAGFANQANAALDSLALRFPRSALIIQMQSKLDRDRGPGAARLGPRAMVEMAPELYAARIALIEQLEDENEIEEAQRELSRAIEMFGLKPELRAMRGNLEMKKGEIEQVLRDLMRAVEEDPGSLSHRSYVLQMLEMLDRPQALERFVADCVDARPDNPGLLRKSAASAYQRRDYRQAANDLRAALRVGARADVIHAELATVLNEAQLLDQACEVLREGIRHAPMSSGLHLTLGSLLLRLDRPAEAKPLIRRHVELTPTSFVQREVLRALENQPSLRTVFRREEAGDLMRQELDWCDPNAAAVRLLESIEVILYPDGAREQRHHLLTKIRSEAGAELHRTESVPQSVGPDVSVEIARTLKPNGHEVEAEIRSGEVAYGDLEPEDVIELRYSIRSGPLRGLPGHFWSSYIFDTGIPTALTRFSIVSKSDQPLHTRLHNVELDPEVSEIDGWRLQSWEMRRVEGASTPAAAPPALERVPWLDLSTLASWEQIVEWYAGIAKGRTRATPALRARALDLTADAETDSAKVHAVARFVRGSIQYEGGSFIDSGLVPFAAETVLRRGFGDCKDQSALIVALLRAVGIDAHMALVNGRDESTVDYLPSPRFTHAIVRAVTGEGRGLWIDPTAGGLAFPNVPIELEGTRALVIEPGSAEFVAIPLDAAEMNGSSSSIDVVLDGAGSGKVSGRCHFVGEDGAGLALAREMAAEVTREFLEIMVAEAFPDAAVSEVALSDDTPAEEPLEMRYRLTAPGIATAASNLLVLRIPWTIPPLPREFVVQERRAEPLVLDSWKGHYEEEIRMVLPGEFAPYAPLESVVLDCDQGSYRLEFEQLADDLIRVKRVLQIDAIRIEPHEYEAFRSFLRAAGRAEETQIVLRQQVQPAES